MRKNLLEEKTVNEIVARVQLLNIDSKGKWGEMQVTEMLHHCNRCNNQILTGDIEYKDTTLKQKLIRFLAFNVAPKFPKNLPTEPRNDTNGQIGASEFEREKNKYIQTIKAFATRKEPIELTHPAFGNLNTKQWGIAALCTTTIT